MTHQSKLSEFSDRGVLLAVAHLDAQPNHTLVKSPSTAPDAESGSTDPER